MANSEISNAIIGIFDEQNRSLNGLESLKDPKLSVRNPTEYARGPWEEYLKTYCNNEKKVLFVGINPGPYGMCKTGIPFGEINAVREYLDIEVNVNSTEVEESGRRFWKLIKEFCPDSEDFFGNCFLYNYCPLAFMERNGNRNIVPGDLEESLRNDLEEKCDETLRKIIIRLKPEVVVGIGHYPEERAKNVLKNRDVFEEHNIDVKVLYMMHPSPRTDLSYDEWYKRAKTMIIRNNLNEYFGNAAN